MLRTKHSCSGNSSV